MRTKALPKPPKASSPEARAVMQGNRSKGTRLEQLFLSELKAAKVSGFRKNYKRLPGSPDLAFIKERVALFLNGCFWHRCPYCRPHFPSINQEYWAAKFQRNRLRDNVVRKKLNVLGWKPITIWECSLKKGPRRAALKVLKLLQDRHDH